MKFNKIIFSLLVVFILTAGIGFIFAEELTVRDISFDVPENYSVNQTNEDSCLLISDNGENYTINILYSESSNPTVEKHSRSNSGFNLLSEEDYTSINNISVNKQDFIKNESFYSFYSLNVDDNDYMIIYSFPVIDEDDANDSNPVEEIINSIH